MNASFGIAAPLLASAVLSILTGCRQEQMQRCVDEHNMVIDDSLCQSSPRQQTKHGGQSGHLYRYYYGGTGTYYPGSVAARGGYAPMPGASYATSRGGFNYGRGGRK